MTLKRSFSRSQREHISENISLSKSTPWNNPFHLIIVLSMCWHYLSTENEIISSFLYMDVWKPWIEKHCFLGTGFLSISLPHKSPGSANRSHSPLLPFRNTSHIVTSQGPRTQCVPRCSFETVASEDDIPMPTQNNHPTFTIVVLLGATITCGHRTTM